MHLGRVDLSEVELVDLLQHQVVRGAHAPKTHRVMYQVKSSRIIATICLVWVHLVRHARLVNVKAATVAPIKPLVDTFALAVTLDQLLDLFFDNEHVPVENEAAHEVVCQVVVPLLAHGQIENGPQEVLHILSLIGEHHADHNGWIFGIQGLGRRAQGNTVD